MNTYQDKKYPTVSGAAAEDETVAGAASGAYRPSSTMGWNAQMENIMQQINDRKPFQFDLNGDALYQQYKDQYTNLGKLAMEDTMGQATGLTGGYGNTYAQNAGQQAYNAYMDKLNGIVPDIYAQQRAAYDAEGDRLYNQFNLANAMYGNAQAAEQQAYERDKADRASADDKIISLIQMGIMPSEDDIAASSYSAEEIGAMKTWFANQQAGGSSSGGSRSGGGGSRNGSGSGNSGSGGYNYSQSELSGMYSKYQNGGVSQSDLESYVKDYAKKNGISEDAVWQMLAGGTNASGTGSGSGSGVGGGGWHAPSPIYIDIPK